MATPSRGHHFPWFYKELSSHKKVHTVVNVGGVVKTLRRGNSLSRCALVFSFSLVRHSLVVVRVFSAVFLCFPSVFAGVQKGNKNPWCFGSFSWVFT